MVYGFLTVSASGADWGSGAWFSEADRALSCPLRRLRFSRSFAANLCSRWAAWSVFVMGMQFFGKLDRRAEYRAGDRRFLALRRDKRYGKGAPVAPGNRPLAKMLP